jgi:adenylate cyclase
LSEPEAGHTRLLTPRQLEVLELLAKGLTNPEIAGVLGIAAGTVKLHVSAVIAALGVTNRTEAAVALGELTVASSRSQGREAGTRVPGFGDRPALVVLPFDNLGTDPEQDHFADGLSEDLTTALACWRWFPVIARNSAFSYRGRSVDVTQVAAELGARYVIEGSTRRSGGRVRVHVQLIDGESGAHLLAERYDFELNDVFSVQDEIVASIFSALEPTLARVEGLRARHKAPQQLTVWESFQRGLSSLNRHDRAGAEDARAFLARAVETGPEFAPAHAALALSRIMDATIAAGRTQGERDADPMEAMRDAAKCVVDALALGRRAVDLDPRDAAAHGALAGALALSGQTQEAEAAFRRSLDLNPSSASASWGLGNLMLATDRSEEASASYQRSLRLSPRDPLLHHFLGGFGIADLLLGRWEEALESFRRSVSVSPPEGMSYLPCLTTCLVLLGREDEARAEARAVFELRRGFNLQLARLLGPQRLIDLMRETYARIGFDLE